MREREREREKERENETERERERERERITPPALAHSSLIHAGPLPSPQCPPPSLSFHPSIHPNFHPSIHPYFYLSIVRPALILVPCSDIVTFLPAPSPPLSLNTSHGEPRSCSHGRERGTLGRVRPAGDRTRVIPGRGGAHAESAVSECGARVQGASAGHPH